MRYLTADLPGTGGLFKASPEDFLVEEVPAYLPCGDGEHTFLFIEKRAATTRDAVLALCKALGNLKESEAGVAGQKDRQAVTRQWVSLPRIDPAAAAGLVLDTGNGGEVRVLAAERHRNKLRTGHLRGNRFTLTLRGTDDGVARARAILDALARRGGLPNAYGAQRFGAGGRNRDEGRRLCLGELRVADRFRRRFLISAYQAALFNDYLQARMDEGLLTTVLLGDVMQKRDTGGLFTAAQADLPEVQERISAHLLSVTGPMFGGKMTAPPPGTPAAEREERVLAKEGITPRHFAALGDLAEGTRRPLLVTLRDVEVAAHPEAAGAVVLRFQLPPGSYATVVLSEVMKPTANDLALDF
jgi:tRNA pseudouridine13 synthase